MCFTKPAVPKPGASPAPPPAAGADSLILGPTTNDDEQLRNAGVLGRLALRVGFGGRAPGAAAGGGSGTSPSSPSAPIGSIGSGSGGSTSGGSTGGTTGGSVDGGGDTGGGGAKFTQNRL